MNIRTLGIDTAGFVVTNRFHIALMPVALTAFWNPVLKLPLPLEYYVMIMLTTAGGYIYNMHTDAAEDAVNYSQKYRLFMPDSVLTKYAIFALFAAAFLIALTAGWTFAIYGGVVNFLFSLYSRPLPLTWKGRPLRIKEIPFLKNIYCALCWSVALVLTPYVFLGAEADSLALIAILVTFGFNYFVEVMWDIRDIPGDAAAGFRTVPLIIGEPAAYWALRLVHVLTCAFMLWAVGIGQLPQGFLIGAIHLPAGLVFLEWYQRLPDKDWASHLYILYGAIVLGVGLAWNLFITTGT